MMHTWMSLVLIYISHWHRFGRTHQGQRCQRICPTQRGQDLSLVVVVDCEGVIAHNVTLGAYNTNKFLEFIQTKVIPSLDIQRFILVNNVPFHKSHEWQQAFEDVGHIYFRLLSCSSFLNVVVWVFGHIKIIEHCSFNFKWWCIGNHCLHGAMLDMSGQYIFW
jgi:hypothetical protein